MACQLKHAALHLAASSKAPPAVATIVAANYLQLAILAISDIEC